MKINKIQDLTDENMKEVKASNIVEVFEDSLKKASEAWVLEKNSQEKSIKDLEEKNKSIATQAEQAKKDLEKITEELKTIKADVEKRQKDEAFNVRMAQLDEAYNLDKEDREVIASDIKELDEKGYEAYSKKLAVFMKAKKKSAASTDTVTDVVTDAVTNGLKDKTSVANTTSVDPKGYEKFKGAFTLDKGFKITK